MCLVAYSSVKSSESMLCQESESGRLLVVTTVSYLMLKLNIARSTAVFSAAMSNVSSSRVLYTGRYNGRADRVGLGPGLQIGSICVRGLGPGLQKGSICRFFYRWVSWVIGAMLSEVGP